MLIQIRMLWNMLSDQGLHCQGSYTSGKCQGNLIFFKVRELSGNSVMCQGKMKFCKNVREMSGNFTF